MIWAEAPMTAGQRHSSMMKLEAYEYTFVEC